MHPILRAEVCRHYLPCSHSRGWRCTDTVKLYRQQVLRRNLYHVRSRGLDRVHRLDCAANSDTSKSPTKPPVLPLTSRFLRLARQQQKRSTLPSSCRLVSMARNAGKTVTYLGRAEPTASGKQASHGNDTTTRASRSLRGRRESRRFTPSLASTRPHSISCAPVVAARKGLRAGNGRWGKEKTQIKGIELREKSGWPGKDPIWWPQGMDTS